MLIDLIALAPFSLLKLKNNRQSLLYVIKLIRLKRGIINLKIKQLLEIYRDSQKAQMMEEIENDP